MALANIAKVDAVAAAAIAKINGLVFTAVAPGAFLLDTYTGAAAGYSTRRLATSATNLMRIREDAGDTETDIGYDSNNELDAAAIATHCGTANGFVVSWVDQSGNGNDADQSTNGSQPKIYDGTTQAVITENGKPMLDQNGNNTALNLTTLTNSSCSFWGVVLPFGNYNTFVTADNNEILLMQQVNTDPHTQGMGTPSYFINGSSFTGTTRADLRTELNSSQALVNAFDVDMSDAVWTRLGWQYSIPAYGMQEVLIWESDQSSNRTGIEENINSDYLIYQPDTTPTSGLLADYTGAAAAYSVRQLSDKAVIALRIRRDSDDEETNIGFDSNGDLDTTAISDFCSTANGYVTRWWDQSTNGNHADQATDTNQPQIYNGTAVIEENGKAAVSFVNQHLATSSISVTNGAFLSVGVGTAADAANRIMIGADDSPRVAQFLRRSSTGALESIGFTSSGTAVTATGPSVSVDTQFLGIAEHTGTDLTVYADGVGGTARTYTQRTDNSVLFVGARKINDEYNGKIQELIHYADDQSSNRTGIETDINDYFSIY